MAANKLSLGERLLARAQSDVRREDVADLVPEWAADLEGERLFIRTMTGMERDAWEAYRQPLTIDDGGKVKATINSHNARARAVQTTLVTADGARVFADAHTLGQTVDGEILDRLYTVFLAVNRLVRKEEERLKNAPGGAGSGTPPGSSAAPPANSSAPATAPT